MAIPLPLHRRDCSWKASPAVWVQSCFSCARPAEGRRQREGSSILLGGDPQEFLLQENPTKIARAADDATRTLQGLSTECPRSGWRGFRADRKCALGGASGFPVPACSQPGNATHRCIDQASAAAACGSHAVGRASRAEGARRPIGLCMHGTEIITSPAWSSKSSTQNRATRRRADVIRVRMPRAAANLVKRKAQSSIRWLVLDTSQPCVIANEYERPACRDQTHAFNLSETRRDCLPPRAEQIRQVSVSDDERRPSRGFVATVQPACQVPYARCPCAAY